MTRRSRPVGTPAQALRSLREELRESYPVVGPAPHEEQWEELLASLGAGRAVLEEARRCWRAMLPCVAPSPALLPRVPEVRLEALDAALLDASGLAALRHLARLLPERFPEGRPFTFEQILMLLLHECRAEGEPLAVALKRTRLVLFGAPEAPEPFAQWFSRAAGSEALEALAYAALTHQDTTP